MFGVVPPTQALYYTHYFNVNMKRRKKRFNVKSGLLYLIQIQMRRPYFILLECISGLKVKKILLEC